MRRILLTGVLLCLSGPALAVYKCESDGKLTYGDAPCPGGKTIAADSVAPADAAQARKRAAEERKRLKQAESEHRKSELKEEKARRRTASTYATQQKKCATLAQRQQWANEDAASATARSSAKARLKARRAAERYEQECGAMNARQLGISGT